MYDFTFGLYLGTVSQCFYSAVGTRYRESIAALGDEGQWQDRKLFSTKLGLDA